MADLNLTATLTDGGGTQPFTFPARANDANLGTGAVVDAFAAGAGTYTAYLVSDLGAAGTVDRHVIYGEDNCGTTPTWATATAVSYSTDGLAWTDVTGYAASWNGLASTGGITTITHAPVAARYWRLRWQVVLAGLGYVCGCTVLTWEVPRVRDPGVPDGAGAARPAFGRHGPVQPVSPVLAPADRLRGPAAVSGRQAGAGAVPLTAADRTKSSHQRAERPVESGGEQ